MSEPDYDFLEEDVPDEVVTESVPETVESNTAPEVVAQAPAAVAPEATTAPAKEDHVPLAALMAEREKRQKEEAARKEVERRLAEYEQRQPPIPAFNENPEAHLRAVEQRTQQRFFQALEAHAREVYPDFDEVVNELAENHQGNPVVTKQVFESANPALTAYKLGKQLREMQAMQDPAAYRAKVEAEVRAAIAAEAATKDAARAAAQSAIPPELSAARAAKDNDAPVDDDSLDSILATRNKR